MTGPSKGDEPPGSPASAPSRRWLTLGGRITVSLAVLCWLIYRLEWQTITQVLGGIRLELFAFALALYCLAQVVSSYRWRLLARPVGFSEPLPRFVALYFVGMFFNLFLPTSMGGDVVRAWYLARGPGRRWLAALSVVSERLAGLVALVIIASLATVVNWGVLPTWMLAAVWLVTAALMVGLIALPVLGRWQARLRSLAESLSLYRHQRGPWLTALGLSFIVQLLGILQVWLLAVSLDLPPPLYSYAVVVPLITLLTMLPISVNGVGVREGSLVLLLGPVGVDQAGAVALGLVWFAMLTAASVLGGGVYVLGRYSQKEVKESHGSLRCGAHQGREGKPAAAA